MVGMFSLHSTFLVSTLVWYLAPSNRITELSLQSGDSKFS